MPLPRQEVLPSALLVHDEGENAAVLRGKSSRKLNGASVKQRVALGVICKNRTAPTNVVKADTSENALKEPIHLATKSIASKKKTVQDSENLPDSIEENAAPVARPETERSRSFSSQNLNVEEIDVDPNPQLVAVYAKDIYKYLHEFEEKTLIKPNYMEGYKIVPEWRTILIDWMVQVHGYFKLLQETLYLTVAITDRFLQIEPTIDRYELQLVGLTSMFIAAKFEEICFPDIPDFVFMSDKAYTKKEMLRMEYRILKKLDFNLGRPLPLHFLSRYTKAVARINDWVDVLYPTMSKYLMELSLLEYDFCHYLPSQLAAAALCLSLKIFDVHDTSIDILWSDALKFYSGYDYEALEPIVAKFCSLLIKSETSEYQAIRKKYLGSEFYCVSSLAYSQDRRIHAFSVKMPLKN